MASMFEELLLEDYPLVRITRECSRLGIPYLPMTREQAEQLQEEVVSIEQETFMENLIRAASGEPKFVPEQVPTMDVRVVR